MENETIIILASSSDQKKVEGYAWIKTASFNAKTNWNDSGAYYKLSNENSELLKENPVGIFNATYKMRGSMTGNVMCYVDTLELVQSFNQFI